MNEILEIIDLYDDFNDVKASAYEAAQKIGRENLNEIPKFLNELDIGYKFYFTNYTLGFTDTVIYAK